MAGYRSSKFFWQDYANEPGLKLCSLAAQGLWMRMLCICADADPVGYLTIEGAPVPLEDLATLVSKPVDEIRPLVDELGRRRVYSRTANGTIYNRRMVRDAKRAASATANLPTAAEIAASHANGSKGGRPAKQGSLDLGVPVDESHAAVATETQAKPETKTQGTAATTPKPVNDNDDSAFGPQTPGFQNPSPNPESDSQEETRDSVLRALRAPKGAPRTADPVVRKQVWEQRILTELRTSLDVDEYVRVAEAYARGEPWARQRFEQVDQALKSAKVNGRGAARVH